MSKSAYEPIVWRDQGEVPDATRKVAVKRVRPFIAFYGRFIDVVSLQLLAESLYLQGVQDGMLVSIREMLPSEPLDFQI